MSKGANFERQCMAELRDAGWEVTRSAGSRGHADLWAMREEAGRTRVLLIQAKSGKQICGPREWNQLVQLAEQVVATPVIADKAPGVKAARWWRITGLKSGRGERQPRVPLDIHAWDERQAA